MSSMFGHLAARFSSGAENLATEALAYMLVQSPAARRALNEISTILNAKLSEIRSFRTQCVGQDQAIPDLAGFDHCGRAILLIENKFWAGLTPNQPAAYLERLPNDEPSLLLFVVPPRRVHSIWPDLVVSAARAGLHLPPPSIRHANALSGQVGNRTLAVTSWQALLDRIEAEARASGEADTVSDVGQLRGLCEHMDSTGYVPATLEELTSTEVPRRLIGLADLVQQACERALAAGIADRKGLLPAHKWYGAGRYLRIGGAGAWVGIDHQLWARYGIGPLWITFAPTEYGRAAAVLNAIAPWLSSNPVRAFDLEGNAAIPLRITSYATRDIVLDDLHSQIAELCHLLRAIPSAREPATPEPAEDAA
ncbi:PD-(D/E)XK nuclease family protein [Blastochloris sulfoviridis]|uniref:PD-(D/E)XK nuclease family protein n=1 Tax=Blastochloris sulfoviridis TaxID=50712 RepID=A0A5M6HX27_9HYPH|nr:PD-(D/E)XK nuclease family protein [Blastochloris sulfoviridis]KAA5600463.1 hypothetical protein F1193_10525 [Blastochloris sulfoviridis]